VELLEELERLSSLNQCWFPDDAQALGIQGIRGPNCNWFPFLLSQRVKLLRLLRVFVKFFFIYLLGA